MGFENTLEDSLVSKVNSLVQHVDNRVQYAEILVSSAEILALNATPKELVAAPGAGKVLELLSAVLILDFNTTAYAVNGVLSVRETDDAGTALSETVTLANFLAQTADTIRTLQPAAGHALAENTPMVLSAATGETTNGDSPVRVKIAYRVHSTGL
jgi:hypothetical protein